MSSSEICEIVGVPSKPQTRLHRLFPFPLQAARGKCERLFDCVYPVGGTLSQIFKIDLSGLSPLLRKVRIVAMCDVDNPLFEKNGAAYVFGPQKGTDKTMVKFLDSGLRHLPQVICEQLERDISQLSGTGAADGMGAW